MGGSTGFLVEEFINSITTQLDRVQDALRIKAVNRPLTYALKELHLELKVFVDMDPDGNVRLRASGPNDTGASVINLDFTTITKPMIEENTISMATARSTPLEELGLAPEERQRLERVGVTNVAQLNRLGASAGVSAVSRFADVPVERLKQAIQMGRPKITGGGTPPKVARPAAPPKTQPPAQPPKPRTPIVSRPPSFPPKPPAPPPRPATRIPAPAPVQNRAPTAGRPLPTRSFPIGGARQPMPIRDERTRGLSLSQSQSADVWVPEGARSFTLHGENLLAQEILPEVRLNGLSLAIEEADNDRLVIRLPETAESGTLEISLADGETLNLALAVEPMEFGAADEEGEFGNAEDLAADSPESSYGDASWVPANAVWPGYYPEDQEP